MNIKLGLISTVAMLSTAVSLGGCNNTKPKAAESAAKVAEVAQLTKPAAEKAADETVKAEAEAALKAEEARVKAEAEAALKAEEARVKAEAEAALKAEEARVKAEAEAALKAEEANQAGGSTENKEDKTDEGSITTGNPVNNSN